MSSRPLLNSLVNKLELLASKLDHLNEVQSQIQKSFDVLESRMAQTPPPSSSSYSDEVPQCGRRVDRVLRTLTPLVSRVEGLWSVVSGFSSPPVNSFNVNANKLSSSSGPSSVQPSQFLGDALLSESRRQERAITAIRSDLNVRVSLLFTIIRLMES